MITTKAGYYETDVPIQFERIRNLCRDWCESVAEEVSEFDDCFHHSVYEVENNARDGFIPFTDGGFDGIVRASMLGAYGSGFIPKPIQPIIDNVLTDVKETWDEENPEHPFDWIFGDEDTDQGTLAKTGVLGPSREREHWKEKYWEYENEVWGDDTYFYKVRCLFQREGTVLFCVAINTDINYGRDHIPWLRCYGGNPQQSQWLWEKEVQPSKITKKLIERFKTEAVEALRSA